jgi:hypothetical protein
LTVLRALLEPSAETMPFDQVLGQPIRPLLGLAPILFPHAFLGVVTARLFPAPYSDLIWVTCFSLCSACVMLWTPYLLLAGVCFYAVAKLPFPTTLDFAAWRYHALLLTVIAILLWRTWLLWPEWAPLKRKPLPKGAKPAPWWGYVLGGAAVFGLLALMAYNLHFQQ